MSSKEMNFSPHYFLAQQVPREENNGNESIFAGNSLDDSFVAACAE